MLAYKLHCTRALDCLILSCNGSFAGVLMPLYAVVPRAFL